MLKYLWKNKVFLFLLILAVWLVPSTIGLSEQSQTESIVTAIGIDKQNSEFEVSLQYIVPNVSNGPEGLKIISQKGDSVGDAVEKIKLQLGKLSGFAHCKVLVFNDKASEENFTGLLDYLLRRKTNTNSIILINTPDSAKDLLSMSSKLDSDLYSFINNNGNPNEFGDFHDLKTIGDYYSTYFSPVKCLAINSVSVKESQNSSGDSFSSSGGSSQSNSSESSSGSSSETKKEFENKGKLTIIKNSKKLLTLTEEESDNLLWFNPNIKRDTFTIEDYSEGYLKNAKILFNISNKIYKTKASFEGGVPHFEVSIKFYIRTGEVISNDLKQVDYETLQRNYSPKLLKAMEQKMLSSLKLAENNFKENSYDVIKCYETFYKTKNKELKQYLKTLSNTEDFIKTVVFDYKIEFIQGYSR